MLVLDQISSLFQFFDYYGYGRRYIKFVNKTFWGFAKFGLFTRVPEWLWYLLYAYLVLGTHMVFVLLFSRLIYDHFITEPRMRREEVRKYRERQKKAKEEFDRLYVLGSGSCPVLRSMTK